MKSPAFLAVLACAWLSGCAATRDSPAHAHEIRDAATWQALAARPQTSTTARTEVVKFVLDLEDGRVWFANTGRYPVHYFFARDEIPRNSTCYLFQNALYGI